MISIPSLWACTNGPLWKLWMMILRKTGLPTAILVVWFFLNWGLLCGFTFYSPSTKSSETWEFKTWTHGFSFRLNGDQLEETKIEPKIDSFDHLETWKLGCRFFWMDTPLYHEKINRSFKVRTFITYSIGYECSNFWNPWRLHGRQKNWGDHGSKHRRSSFEHS